MKTLYPLHLLACLVVCFVTRPALAQSALKPANILVDGGTVKCPVSFIQNDTGCGGRGDSGRRDPRVCRP